MAYVPVRFLSLATVARTFPFNQSALLHTNRLFHSVLFDFKKTLAYVNSRSLSFGSSRGPFLTSMLLYDDKTGTSNDQLGDNAGDY